MEQNRNDSSISQVLSAAANDRECRELDAVPADQHWLSDRANMDVLKMEQAIEESLSQAMSGLCDQFSQQVVKQEQLQGTDEEPREHTVPILGTEVPSYKGQQQAPLQQQQHLQKHDNVSNLRMEVESLRQDLRVLSGQASSSANFKMADAVGDKVCRDVQVLLNALQARMSSEVSDALGQLRSELSLVKADVARTSECLQHVEGDVRSSRARSANEQLAGRLTAVEEEVQRNSKTLSHVGDILKVTQEITTGSDKMIGRMSYEVSSWREAESRLEKRLLLLEQMFHQLGSFTMTNAEQQMETRQAHEAEQGKEVELQRSADLRQSLETLLGKLGETMQAPPPKRTSYIPVGFQQTSPIGSCNQALSLLAQKPSTPLAPVLTFGGGLGSQGGMPMVVNDATGPGTTSSSQRISPLSSTSLVQKRSVLLGNSGHSDLASTSGSIRSAAVRQVSGELVDSSRPHAAGIHPQSIGGSGYSVIPRQAALSAMPVSHQAQRAASRGE